MISFLSPKVKHLVETNDKITMEDIENELKNLSDHSSYIGQFQPSSSISNRIVLIVPYKNRYYNLKLFLRYIIRFLAKKRSSLDYKIFLVEPAFNNQTFNRGLLLNIGFVESINYFKSSSSDQNNENIIMPNCFIFHDVDMLPENDSNDYSCSKMRPKQLAVAINTYKYSYEI
jgi:hypothetical protein